MLKLFHQDHLQTFSWNFITVSRVLVRKHEGFGDWRLFQCVYQKDMIPWMDLKWWTLIWMRPCGHLPVSLTSLMGQGNNKTICYNRKGNTCNDIFGTRVRHFFTIFFCMLSTVFLIFRQPVWSGGKKWLNFPFASIFFYLINLKFKTIKC